jgi:arabinan endo-1,5-alpha-L-arabinosidase
MRLKRIAVLLAALSLAIASSLPASATADGSFVFRYVNKNSGMCLAVPGGSSTDGAKLIQFRCSGGGQDWTSTSSGWSTITNGDNRKCLAIPGGSTTQGVQAIQWTCNGGQEQVWNADGVTIDTFATIVNYKSRMCLAVSGASKAEGAAVIQWPCNAGAEQQWKILVTG